MPESSSDSPLISKLGLIIGLVLTVIFFFFGSVPASISEELIIAEPKFTSAEFALNEKVNNEKSVMQKIFLIMLKFTIIYQVSQSQFI